MREYADFEEDDLLKLIADEREESIDLDYKASAALEKTDARKNDVSKDVAAFANSAGGVLIYGIREENHKPKELDDGLDPNEITKEWLEQVILSRIQPRVPGLIIRPVPLKKTRTGRIAYVVVIPQSPRAPHMSSDNRYYKRFNFLSIAMQHYEVDDVARRIKGPDLFLRFVTDSWERQDAGLSFKAKFKLHPIVTNDAEQPAEYALIELFMSPNLVYGDASSASEGHQVDLTIDDQSRTFRYFKQLMGIPHDAPIFKTVPWAVLRRPFVIDMPARPKVPPLVFHLGWRVRAPTMTPRFGAVRGALTSSGVILDPVELENDPFPV